MIYGYIRVSTDKQTMENQRYEINNYCVKAGYIVDEWVEETISSTKGLDKRKLGSLLNRFKTGDTIIASELSRLGRNLMQIMSILHHCLSNDVQVHTIKDNYRLGNDIQSKVLAFAFGLSAEIERNLISQRTKEALARRKSEGQILGRPKGSKSTNKKLTGKEDEIQTLLDANISYSAIGRILKTHRLTVSSFVNENMQKMQRAKAAI